MVARSVKSIWGLRHGKFLNWQNDASLRRIKEVEKMTSEEFFLWLWTKLKKLKTNSKIRCAETIIRWHCIKGATTSTTPLSSKCHITSCGNCRPLSSKSIKDSYGLDLQVLFDCCHCNGFRLHQNYSRKLNILSLVMKWWNLLMISKSLRLIAPTTLKFFEFPPSMMNEVRKDLYAPFDALAELNQERWFNAMITSKPGIVKSYFYVYAILRIIRNHSLLENRRLVIGSGHDFHSQWWRFWILHQDPEHVRLEQDNLRSVDSKTLWALWMRRNSCSKSYDVYSCSRCSWGSWRPWCAAAEGLSHHPSRPHFPIWSSATGRVLQCSFSWPPPCTFFFNCG